MRFSLPWLSGVTFLLVLSVRPADDGAIQADDAVLANGKRLHGKLAFGTDQRLRFTADGPAAAPSLADIHDVRFPAAAVIPFRAGTIHTLLLSDDQRLTGVLLGLDDKQISLRTPWDKRLVIPRHAVHGVVQLPGAITFFEEDFENGLKAWKLKGTPDLSDHRASSGRLSLLLATPGQEAEHALSSPLTAGEVAIHFYHPGDTTGARWKVEADFGADPKLQTLAVVVAGVKDTYGVEAPALGGETLRLAPVAGWHQLSLRFSRDYVVAGIDRAPLWSSEKRGLGGPLRKLRLACVAQPGESTVKGEVCFDDLTLARPIVDLPRPANDPGQDEVWLADGDQLFGQLPRADRHTITLLGPFGKRVLPWGAARGVYLRRQTSPPQTTDGEHVRVWLRPAGGATPDELSGVLRGLDDRRLTLHHARLGNLTVERGRLQRLQWLFHGRHIELDNGTFHLGDKDRVVPTLYPPRAQALSVQRKFHLDAVPDKARLVLHASHLKGPADGIAAALERGELRTEVVMNGQTVDYLNRHVERFAREPRRLSVHLPRSCLRAGENVLELRQTPEAGTGHCESCGISGVALEIRP